MNLVSGDMVINASLAVIWHTAVEYKRTRLLQPKVYHLTNQKKDNLAYVGAFFICSNFQCLHIFFSSIFIVLFLVSVQVVHLHSLCVFHCLDWTIFAHNTPRMLIIYHNKTIGEQERAQLNGEKIAQSELKNQAVIAVSFSRPNELRQIVNNSFVIFWFCRSSCKIRCERWSAIRWLELRLVSDGDHDQMPMALSVVPIILRDYSWRDSRLHSTKKTSQLLENFAHYCGYAASRKHYQRI